VQQGGVHVDRHRFGSARGHTFVVARAAAAATCQRKSRGAGGDSCKGMGVKAQIDSANRTESQRSEQIWCETLTLGEVRRYVSALVDGACVGAGRLLRWVGGGGRVLV
jgi:hypothetical protein